MQAILILKLFVFIDSSSVNAKAWLVGSSLWSDMKLFTATRLQRMDPIDSDDAFTLPFRPLSVEWKKNCRKNWEKQTNKKYKNTLVICLPSYYDLYIVTMTKAES